VCIHAITTPRLHCGCRALTSRTRSRMCRPCQRAACGTPTAPTPSHAARRCPATTGQPGKKTQVLLEAQPREVDLDTWLVLQLTCKPASLGSTAEWLCSDQSSSLHLQMVMQQLGLQTRRPAQQRQPQMLLIRSLKLLRHERTRYCVSFRTVYDGAAYHECACRAMSIICSGCHVTCQLA
jgi:hypothetical protein